MNSIKLNLRKIDPIKWGIISGILYAVISLIVVVPLFLIMSAVGVEDLAQNDFPAAFAGVGLLFIPIIYGVIGFILGILITALLNVILSKTGGLDMEFNTDNVNISNSGIE
jgi:heme/copper-type cytochrome/quinol oxidase subunit 4